jgi:hypothetical protein
MGVSPRTGEPPSLPLQPLGESFQLVNALGQVGDLPTLLFCHVEQHLDDHRQLIVWLGGPNVGESLLDTRS